LDDNHLVCLVHFIDNKMPEMYVLPSTVWNKPNDLFVSRDYGKPGQKSKPEWGINYSEKNKHLLEKYKTEKVLNDILLLRKE